MRYKHPLAIFDGKTAAEIAASLAPPGSPAYLEYLEILPRTLAPEYIDRLQRFFSAFVEACRKHGPPISRVRCEDERLVTLAREQFLWRATLCDYDLTEEHVRRPLPHYTPHWLLTESAKGEEGLGWPTSWGFRFAQNKWKKSLWYMVPDFPPAMLALAGFNLVSTSRWMGDDVLTGEERAEFCVLQRKSEFQGGQSLKPSEVERRNDLLELMPYGGELPILDVDVARATHDADGNELTPEQAAKIHAERGAEAARIAGVVTGVWRQIAGVTPRWTVTNDRGGLHGLNLPLPPHVRHPDLLRALLEEMRRLLPATDVPFMVKGDESERTGAVKLDLTAYNKYSRGRGGMWRVPLCAKDDPGSLPQAPVAEYVAKMHWLETITPEAIGSDWQAFGPEAGAKILEICSGHRKRIDELDLRRGSAYRDASTGQIKRVRHKAVAADADLGTAELPKVAETLRDLMPTGEHEGGKRHQIRLAIAGWLYKHGTPKEAALSTLLASGRNEEDSRKAVDTTYARGLMGDTVMGISRLEELLGRSGAQRLHEAFSADREERERENMLREEQEPDHEEETGRIALRRKEETKDAQGADSGDEGEDEGGDGHEGREPTTGKEPPPPPPSLGDIVANLGGLAPAVPPAPEPSPEGAPSNSPSPESGGGVAVATKKKAKAVELSPAELLHPKTPQQLCVLEAKERVHSLWDAPTKALVKTRHYLFGLKAKLSAGGSDWGKQFFCWKTLGRAFALGGLSHKTVLETVRGGGMSEILTHHKAALNDLRHYAPGKPLPQFLSIKAIRSTIGWKDWNELVDALHEDLKDAPFDVKHRLLVDLGYSSRDRDTILWTVECLERSGWTRRPEFKAREYKRVQKAAKCTRIANVHECAEHGDVTTCPIYCHSEVACAWCRANLHDTIAAWVESKWQHDSFVVFEWTASTEPVLVEVRDELEEHLNSALDDDPNWIAPERSPEDEEARVNKRFVLRRDKEGELEAAMKEAIRNTGRLERRRRLGRALSMDRLDQIKKGFAQTKDLKILKQTTANQLGYRAFPTLTGVVAVLPSIWLEPSPDGVTPDERPTLEHLKKIDAFQGCKPRVVTKDELVSILIKARQEVGTEFDRLVHEFTIEAAKTPTEPTPHEEDRPPGPAALAMLTFPFLRERAMVPIRNKTAEEELPWYSAESLKAFKKELREARFGPDAVKPGECPVPVLQPDGTTRPCRRICCTKLEDLRTKEILARNSTGKMFAPKDAFAIADARGFNYGVIVPSRFGPTEPARC